MFYGTQYYRSPTPLEGEWEQDLSHMGEYGLNTIQLRINWRNNERNEDHYDFSDLDKLFELAEKYNKQVVIKFLLECAPQYIFDKYEGTRIGPYGEKIRGGYHGAFYGGWQPCFSNPQIQLRAKKFVQEVVKRYKDRKNLILYNAWNEIRNRPIEECFCKYCKKSYHDYLRNKFHTIDNLNKFYGASEESFETIDLPSTPHGVWDIYEFKKFKGEDGNYQKVKLVYDAIKELDDKHPVMCHVGYTSGYQMDISDVCNDFKVCKAVDFWGTSLPFEHHMDTVNNRLDLQLVNDFIRSVNDHYFVHELYPSLGMYRLYDDEFDMEYKIFKSLSRGTKGICFWQYRSERVGHEMDCSGLMYMNGEPRKVIKPVSVASAFIEEYDEWLYSFKALPGDIAIIHDFDSMLLSEIEDNFGPDFKWGLWNPLLYYFKAHQGLYRLINRNNYSVDYLSTYKMDNLNQYKLVFAPDLSMLRPETAEKLEQYVEKGGVLVIDDGFGLRDQNTWVNPYNIKTKMFDGWLEFRLREHRDVVYKNNSYKFGPYTSIFRIKNSKVTAKFDNKEPAIQQVTYGKGKVIILGFSLGYDAYDNINDGQRLILDDIAASYKIQKKRYQDIENGIEENRLYNKYEQMLFLFNTSNKPQEIEIKEHIIHSCYKGTLKENRLSIKPKSIAVLRIK